MKKIIFYLILACLFSSCIKDDIIDDEVEPTLRITNPVENLEINTTYQFEYRYLNNIGAVEDAVITWSSSDDTIVEIDETGLATANAIGTAVITAEYLNEEAVLITDTTSLEVSESPTVVAPTLQSISGTIATTTFYVLEGDFEYRETDTGVILDIASNYEASSGLPGLYVYLSNNRNSIANAHEIGAVSVFSGAHTYEIEDIGFQDYRFIVYFCKPFNVKVGEAELNF